MLKMQGDVKSEGGALLPHIRFPLPSLSPLISAKVFSRPSYLTV